MMVADLETFRIDTIGEIVKISHIGQSANCDMGLEVSFRIESELGLFEPSLDYRGLGYSQENENTIAELQEQIDQMKVLNEDSDPSNDQPTNASEMLNVKLGLLWDQIADIRLVGKDGTEQSFMILDIPVPDGFAPSRMVSAFFITDDEGNSWTLSDSTNFNRTRSFFSEPSLTLIALDEKGEILLKYGVDEACLKTRFQKVFDLYVRMNAHRKSVDV